MLPSLDSIKTFVSRIVPEARTFLLVLWQNYCTAMFYNSDFAYIFTWKSLEPFGQSNQDFRSFDSRAPLVKDLQKLTDVIAVSRGTRNFDFYRYLGSTYFNQAIEVDVVDTYGFILGPATTDLTDSEGNPFTTDEGSATDQVGLVAIKFIIDYTFDTMDAITENMREFLIALGIVKPSRIFPFIYPRLILQLTDILTDTFHFTLLSSLFTGSIFQTDQVPLGYTDTLTPQFTDQVPITSMNIAGYNQAYVYNPLTNPLDPKVYTVDPVQLDTMTFAWDIPMQQGDNRIAIGSLSPAANIAFDFVFNVPFFVIPLTPGGAQLVRIIIVLSS